MFRPAQVKRLPQAEIKLTQPFQRIDDCFARWCPLNIGQRERQDPGGNISFEIAKIRRSGWVHRPKIGLVFANNRNCLVQRIGNDLRDDHVSVGFAQRLDERVAADKGDT